METVYAILNTKTVVGLTGMSGAGKTTACEFFLDYGFKIINCDKIALETVAPNTPCFKEIIEFFGDGVLSKNGLEATPSLNRAKIASLIFDDKNSSMKQEYEKIIFPYITYKILNIILKSKENFFLLDAPTLYESGVHELCDFIISIVASEENTINRILKRDGISEYDAKKRLMAQKDKEFYLLFSNFLIENNGDKDSFKTKIRKVIEAIPAFYKV